MAMFLLQLQVKCYNLQYIYIYIFTNILLIYAEVEREMHELDENVKEETRIRAKDDLEIRYDKYFFNFKANNLNNLMHISMYLFYTF